MGNQYQPRRDPPSASSSPVTPLRIVRTRPLIYRDPTGCSGDLDCDQTTMRVPTPAEVERLQKAWLRNPTFDIEWAVGFESIREELANWHRDQIQLRCQALQCSLLMGAILEELVHCWMDCKPPVSPLARRILLSFG